MKRLCLALVALLILNFVVFFAVAVKLGGTAAAGKIEDAKFFVGDHGHYTEVSQSTYEFSRWHGCIFFFGHFGLLIAVLVLDRLEKKPPISK